jgi:hypothetical protein
MSITLANWQWVNIAKDKDETNSKTIVYNTDGTVAYEFNNIYSRFNWTVSRKRTFAIDATNQSPTTSSGTASSIAAYNGQYSVSVSAPTGNFRLLSSTTTYDEHVPFGTLTEVWTCVTTWTLVT